MCPCALYAVHCTYENSSIFTSMFRHYIDRNSLCKLYLSAVTHLRLVFNSKWERFQCESVKIIQFNICYASRNIRHHSTSTSKLGFLFSPFILVTIMMNNNSSEFICNAYLEHRTHANIFNGRFTFKVKYNIGSDGIRWNSREYFEHSNVIKLIIIIIHIIFMYQLLLIYSWEKQLLFNYFFFKQIIVRRLVAILMKEVLPITTKKTKTITQPRSNVMFILLATR